MALIRITREFNFEMAHALLGYDGKCNSIHGHSYGLSVTITGNPLEDHKSPKNGMVMDFSILKEIVNKEVIIHFDHAIVLNENFCEKEKISGLTMFSRLILVPYQPTCENLLIDFAARISRQLPLNVKLHNLKLRETANSFAEWFAEDN